MLFENKDGNCGIGDKDWTVFYMLSIIQNVHFSVQGKEISIENVSTRMQLND